MAARGAISQAVRRLPGCAHGPRPGLSYSTALSKRRRAATEWESPAYQREFLLGVRADCLQRHGITDVSETSGWRYVRRKDVEEAGGRGLLRRHGDSFSSLLREAFPEELGPKPLPAYVHNVASEYWELESNRRDFVAYLRKSIGDSAAKGVSYKMLQANGGGGLLRYYDGSLEKVLKDLWPDAKPASRQKGFWQERENRRAFLQQVGEALGVSSFEEWAEVSVEDVRRQGGSGIFRHCEGIRGALRDSMEYTEQEWQAYESAMWLKGVPASDWATDEKVAAYLETVKEEWGITSPEEWQRVSKRSLKQALLRNMSLREACRVAFPDEQWGPVGEDEKEGRLTHKKKSSQRRLVVRLQEILPAASQPVT